MNRIIYHFNKKFPMTIILDQQEKEVKQENFDLSVSNSK